ncbi:hypothetical protein HDU87_005367 [Geranomyces variabilis]|uniref:Uncharacterized protein n=1 Tax=Geranomyces variabilis TaxID=109894 RepID=A0AAD5XLV5_9FUNG|nr:hypothetical protein HDU87_005367 [Geranomyces variabilis]
MKQRFSALDVSAQVAELRPRLVGLRMQNVYDINSKTYLFKFSRPDFKEMLLVESGIRFHSTEFARDKAHTPSHFCMKIRKHLRTRRLTAVNQLGADRVVDLRFGEGEAAYHLILEFFASGNIILTDHEYRILALLRVVEIEGAAGTGAPTMSSDPAGAAAASAPNEGDAKFAVGEIYDLTAARPFQPVTEEKVRGMLESAKAAASQAAAAADPGAGAGELFEEPRTGGKVKGGKKKIASTKKSNKDKNKSKENTLRKVIRDKMSQDYGPALVDHCISRSGLDVGLKISEDLDVGPNSTIVLSLLEAFREGDTIVRSCIESPQKGWIILRALDTAKNGAASPPRLDVTTAPNDRETASTAFVAYDEFHPILFQQFVTDGAAGAEPRSVEFSSFDKCVDEFYSKLEAQKLELRARQAEMHAVKKLESVKAGHESHVRGLHVLQEESAKTAQAIEANLLLVDSIINTVRSFIASGMDWTDLEDLVKEEKKKGNPVASVITKLRLDVGMVTIQLRDTDWTDSDDDDDDADETDSEADSVDENEDENGKQAAKPAPKEPTLLSVDLDIYMSAFANARRYYDTKKGAAVKQDKTLQAAEKVIKAAERKIGIDLKSTQQVTPAITKMRKPYWFEKFLWFISSENYLVVGGRDATQNELLVKRYLKKGDIYVHADLHGAASVIVKNIADPDAPRVVPPTTLHQAGTMSVCMSRAWDAKIVTSAWWVDDTQVSKTAPTGEYLTTGSFMIRGKKNWLPPVQLIYGFAILFKVDESCAARHYWERRPWRRQGEDGEAADQAGGITDGVAPQADAEQDNANFAELREDDIANGDNDEADAGSGGHAENQNAPGVDDSECAFEAEQEDESEDRPTADSTSAAHEPPEEDDKYAYEDDDIDQALGVPPNDPSAAAAPAKKRLTAKERRDIRKARAVGGTGGSDSSLNKDQDAADSSETPASVDKGKRRPAQNEKTQQQPPAVRGKRGKAKKIKSKYADQDEDDMELMLSLLGSRKVQKQGPPEKLSRGDVAGTKVGKTQSGSLNAKGKAFATSEPPHIPLSQTASDIPTAGATHSSVSEGAEGQAPSKTDATPEDSFPRRGSNSAEITRLLAEENILQLPEDTDTSFIDTLTGIPHHTDVVLHAVAVCAPWSALTKYKYKAKLVPGSSKKGKAINTLIAAFCAAPAEPARKPRRDAAALMDNADLQEQTRRDDTAKRERDLIKLIPDMEMTNSLLGKVKVVLGNADLANAKSASGKKGASKGGR